MSPSVFNQLGHTKGGEIKPELRALMTWVDEHQVTIWLGGTLKALRPHPYGGNFSQRVTWWWRARPTRVEAMVELHTRLHR